MDPLPIVLPTAPASPRRQPLPFLAAVMPVLAGVVLWLVTGSLFSLCFAALGPLMMAASLFDSARGRRKEQRRADADDERAWAAAEEHLQRMHDDERRQRTAMHPDAAACIRESPLRGTAAPGADLEIIIGRGVVASGVRTTGGDHERARGFQERARVLSDAPIAVALGVGVCLRGPLAMTAAVARALVLQLSLRFAPGQLSIAGADAVADVEHLPHAARWRSGLRVAVASSAGAAEKADALIWMTDATGDVPDGITTVLDVAEPGRASLRTPDGVVELAAEGVSEEQFGRVAIARLTAADADVGVPEQAAFDELPLMEPSNGLPASIGATAAGAAIVDIVEDGPHAIVTGTTGTGKSELLVTWVTAIAAAHGPDRVNFVLADFKGGTAFDPLRSLRHVAAVITDLDEDEARRGVSSLRAELRRREGVLAAAGVRDVAASSMPRLVVVVDEFAALLQDHPDLGALFTDIAARGRALGMHLILGTQRAAGVVRDSLAANCPLRLSLRLSDAADSRAVIGTTEAAEIPGGPSARGFCLIRRPQDQEPEPARIALTRSTDLARIIERWEGEPAPRSPWLPPLPLDLPLSGGADDRTPQTLEWGRADEPESQSQPPLLLRVGEERGVAVIGAPGSGRSSALRVLAAQRDDAVWIPTDLESMWDAVRALAEGETALPSLVLCDDLDARIAELPPEYAQALLQWWDQILRSATGSTVIITAMRVSGPVGRVLDILPRRALLRAASRVDHIAAGGDSSTFDERRPPGRVRIDGREAQFALVRDSDAPTSRGLTEPAFWSPTMPLTGIVTAGAADLAASVRERHPSVDVHVLGAAGHSGSGLPPSGPGAEGPRVVVGDAESWQREWSLWQRVRAEGEVLVRAERPADLRQLVGYRELPPYARLHAGRAWAVQGGEVPRRVVLRELANAGTSTTRRHTAPLLASSAPSQAPSPRLSPSQVATRRSRRRVVAGAPDAPSGR